MANSKYILHGLNLTDGQLEKIIRASQNHESVVVRTFKDNLNGNNHKIPLTKTQVERITRTKNGFNLPLSSAQLKYLKKSGVFYRYWHYYPSYLPVSERPAV